MKHPPVTRRASVATHSTATLKVGQLQLSLFFRLSGQSQLWIMPNSFIINKSERAGTPPPPPSFFVPSSPSSNRETRRKLSVRTTCRISPIHGPRQISPGSFRPSQQPLSAPYAPLSGTYFSSNFNNIKYLMQEDTPPLPSPGSNHAQTVAPPTKQNDTSRCEVAIL